jgi:hypothetical protein
MFSSIPISAASWVPVSAYYPYDDSIQINNTPIRWTDGYTAFTHNAFENGNDYSINKDTILYLSSAKNLFSFIQESSLSDIYLGAYISLSIDTGAYFDTSKQYVTVIDSTLSLNPLSTDNSFFRFLINDDGSFSLFQGPGLYVTVDTTTPFNLTLQRQLAENFRYRQKFYWHEQDNRIYFTTKITNPNVLGSPYEERFWSFSKAGPEMGRIRANGFVPFNDYTDAYKNDYLFDVTGFVVCYSPTGLITDHTWVRYYNDLNDKIYNKNVEILESQSISGVFVNHLFDLPYNTKINIDSRGMALNFANLKNIMTAEYDFKIKVPYTN